MFCFLPTFVVDSVSESESDFCDTLVRVYATLSLSHEYSYSQILANLLIISCLGVSTLPGTCYRLTRTSMIINIVSGALLALKPEPVGCFVTLTAGSSRRIAIFVSHILEDPKIGLQLRLLMNSARDFYKDKSYVNLHVSVRLARAQSLMFEIIPPPGEYLCDFM